MMQFIHLEYPLWTDDSYNSLLSLCEKSKSPDVLRDAFLTIGECGDFNEIDSDIINIIHDNCIKRCAKWKSFEKPNFGENSVQL